MIINCAYMNKAIFFRIVSGQLCKYMEDNYCICRNETYWVEIDYTHCFLNRPKLDNLNISQALKGLLVDPNSAKIRTLIVKNTVLTEIPRELYTLSSQLEKLVIVSPDPPIYTMINVPIMFQGTIHCALRWLNLSSIELERIEPGAFEGDLIEK